MPNSVFKYQFFDKDGKSHTIDKQEFDEYKDDFVKQFPDAQMRMVDPNGESWNIPVSNMDAAMKEGGYRMWNMKVGGAQQQPAETAEPQQTQVQQQAGPYTPTWQEQMSYGMTASQAENVAKNASSGIDQQEKDAKTYQDKVYGQTPQIGRQGRVVQDGPGYITDDGTRYSSLAEANKDQQQTDSFLASKKQQEEYEEPSLYDTAAKSLKSGIIRTGTGILNAMQQLSSGMIVEDASSPTGYMKTQDYETQLRDSGNAVTRGLNAAHERADQLSSQAQPKRGKGFLDMLWDGEIGSFLQKGVAVAGESLPMTLSAFNPYTMVLNGISLAGNNYREETLENPNIPTWKRASMAIGSAAIEQAVEKFADPVFKYIGGGKILKKAGKEASEEITKEVTKKATDNLAKRIYKGMGGLAKDAAGEGAEEVITNFGNDALGQLLDGISGDKDYGLEAQWDKMKEENPDATLWDFAQQKAKENVESFIGGAMAGAYTSGTTQLSAKAIEYGVNHMASEQQIAENPGQPLSPVTVELAQSFDEGYNMESEKDKEAASERYTASKSRLSEILDEDAILDIDINPTSSIANISKMGLDEEGQKAVYEYINTKALYDGMEQRMYEDSKRSRVNSYTIKGNTIEEVDKDGNVLATHEYDNREDMKIGLFELNQTRANNDMMVDVRMMTTNPKYKLMDIIEEYSEPLGVDAVDFLEIIYKDPMERTEAEQQMILPFARILHDTLYDSNTLHEEQSAEDGEKVADAMSIDINEGDTTEAADIAASYNNATNALNELFARNENLKQEVESMEQQGIPRQGIVSSLETFAPNEVQTVIDFYNQQARYEGFRLRMAQKIDEEAANIRQRNTFMGTVNGQPNQTNIVTVSDGANTYTLVSGNVTTDPNTGRVIDSDSGMLIAVDQNGDFVKLGDSSELVVMPSDMTLQQFEDTERTRLQEEITSKIAPQETIEEATQPVQQEQATPQAEGGSMVQTGGEAGAANVAGENEPPVPSSTTIESVIDEDGVKHYEKGIDVDTAVADMINDKLDVISEADLAINEAQGKLDKIKEPKTRAERIKNAEKEKELQNAIDYYNNVKERWTQKVDENVQALLNGFTGSPEYATATWLRAKMQEAGLPISNELAQSYIDRFVEERKSAEQAAAEEAERQRQAEEARLRAEEERRKAEEITDKDLQLIEENKNTPQGRAWLLDRKRVPNYEKRRKIAKLIYGDRFNDDFDAPQGIREYISMWLGKQRSLDPDSFGQELGWDMSVGKDAAKVSTMFTARRENGGDGILFSDFVHMLMENSNGMYDTEELRNEIIQMFNSAEAKWDLTEYQLTNRVDEAERNLQAEEARLMEQQENEELEDNADIADGFLPFPPAKDEEEKKPESKFKKGDIVFYRNFELRVEDVNPDGTLQLKGNAAEIGINLMNVDPKDVHFPGSQESIDFYYGVFSDNLERQNFSRDMARATLEKVDERLDRLRSQVDENNMNSTDAENMARLLGQRQAVVDYIDKLAPKKPSESEREILAEIDGYTVRRETTSEDGAFEIYSVEKDGNVRYQVPFTADKRIEDFKTGNYNPGGDGIYSTLEEAKQAIELKRRQARERAEDEEKERQEQERRAKEDAAEKERMRFGGFTDGKAPMQVARIAKTLDKLMRYDDKVNSLAGHIQDWVNQGLEFDAKVFNGENKTTYFVRLNDGSFYELPKTAYDYALFLQNNQEPAGTSDPMQAIEQSAEQFNEEQKSERGTYLAEHPLTEEQIMSDTEATEDEKLNAIDFMKGEDNSAISQFYYDEIFKRAQKKAETVDKRKARFQGRAEKPAAEPTQREAQKSKDQADIDAALKEFNDFLDNAKGNSILDKFMRKGLEGNDKAQASLLDALLLGTNDAQRMFVVDLLRLGSKVGYAYIKSGIHDFSAWRKQMADTIGKKLKEVLGWDDALTNEFVDELWEQKYTVEGVRMRLKEHAERLSSQDEVDLKPEEPVEEKPKTKDGWLRKMNEVYKELCKKYGVPEDPIIFNQYGGRYNFDYRITKGYRLEQFEPYYNEYIKKLDEPVEPASEKQLNYIKKLAGENEWVMVESAKLNKVSASYIITILKQTEDAVTSRYSTASDFDDLSEEFDKVIALSGGKTEAEIIAEKELKNNKGADTTVNVNKKENNEPENVVSSQQEASQQGSISNEEFKRRALDIPGITVFDIFDKRIEVGNNRSVTVHYFDQWDAEEIEGQKEILARREKDHEKNELLSKIQRMGDEPSTEYAKKYNEGRYPVGIDMVETRRIAKGDLMIERLYRDVLIPFFEQRLNRQSKPSELQGDSAEYQERQKNISLFNLYVHDALRNAVFTGDITLKTMQGVKALAAKYGLEDLGATDLQELVEAQIVRLAREISERDNLTDEQKFEYITRLYNYQPSLNARDNDRINMQQYSTPAPMAFLMGKFLTQDKKVDSGLEPSAGNGMLTINLPKGAMHVNDIDEMRLSNLAKQGFKEVTSQDGTKSFGEKKYDVIVTNPPFGSIDEKVYDGIYSISGLEHQMAINALESMKDDGRAAIIIGGNTDYNKNGSIKGKDRAFLNYLYAHYNVVDVINMDGKTLYSRQGTGFPVRMILINGRKKFNPNNFAPVQSKARAEQVKSYDELYKRVNDDILSDNNKPASVYDTESGQSGRVDDSRNAGTSTQTGVRNVQPGGSQGQSAERSSDGRSVSGSNNTTDRTDTTKQSDVDRGPSRVASRTDASQPSRTATQQTGEQQSESGGNDAQRPVAGTDDSQRMGQRGTGTPQQNEQPEIKRGLGTEKVPYRKQSGNPFTLQSLMPAEQADVVKSALEELGDVDQFLVDELGYSSKDELHKALAAEQIDSVALAIHQMNQGNAFIIGDQTGIGKGRQAAALIRYGVKKGGFPVFITVKKGLFSDMYRDLSDIGSPELRPFIWSADDAQHSGNVTDKDGNVIYQMPSASEQKRVVDYINKNGKLPPEYDYVLTTYDSFKSGTMDYENGNKKDRKFPKGKKASSIHFNGQAKRDALEKLAENSYVIMDESHNAGGEGSNVGNFLQYITTKAKGITFLSATFAKRPGNMPIYSLKTAIAKAGVEISELIDAVKRGGATFQEVMSRALTEAGQMIRRERDMTGVTIDWRGIEDESVVEKQRAQYDEVIGLFNEIIDFQRRYVDPIVNKMNDDEADTQGSVDHTPGTRDMGINNTPFASRTYNMVQQILLSLKAEEAAKRAIEHLKMGRKPVITVANTNEGAADEVAAADGESMVMPDLSVNLKKGLRSTLRITKKDAFGNTQNSEIPFNLLSKEGQERYQEIMDNIDNASTGLSLSPIDVIKNELKKAGYKVGELTGRQSEFIYNEDGTVRRVRRQDTDKKKIAADFNNGKIDAIILNRSAGTGISLHASTTFKDQRQRIMIVAQAQGDVNDEVQIRGRIDRTGQVLRGMYEYVVSQIPSEQRLLMMLKSKLRSLDANTTSSQKSKFNEMQVQDIINKYGDQIVIQYLSEHPDYAEKMQNPLKWDGDWQIMPSEQLIANAKKADTDGGTASKVLGRMALLNVKDQEKMLDEIGELYQAEIDRLDEMGENDLEITEMPLKAKTLSKAVWETGIDPGGKNPFADNTYVEKVTMDVLKKPMKGEEVKNAQERLLNGKTWDEFKQSAIEKVEEWAENKKNDTTEAITERAKKKASAEQERYLKGAKKAQEKNQMTDEEIERNGKIQYDTFYNQEMEKLNDAIASIDAQAQVFVDALDTFSTDGVYAIPQNIYDLGSMTFEPGFGKLIDIDIKSNYSPNASTLTFATLDGRRKITVPINGRVKQQNGEKRELFPVINSLTAQTRNGMFGQNQANTLRVLGQNIDNWDKLTSSAVRKEGHIITGNLLKALVSTREQGVGGKLISYTTDTGEVRQGILMPDNFEPAGLTSKTPISSKKDELRWSGDKIVSADGDVTVKKDGWGSWYQLKVPKSNKRGGKYFNDEVLRSLMEGQFSGSSQMTGDFKEENLDAVLKRLDEMGVTVTEEHKDDNNSQNSLSRNAEINESSKNNVPLERRAMKSYTDRYGNYNRGIEEELSELEADINRAGTEDAETAEESTEVRSGGSNPRLNELRRSASILRAEKARRDRKRKELRQKYDIDEKGNISLDNLSRMFNDLNSNKVLGKLFDKVVSVLKNLGVDFRFTDRLDANVGGRATAFMNVTFYNWDSMLRDLDNQEKARILLHELIHNVSSQIMFRYNNPSLGELTDAQKKLANEITDIYNTVKAANPINEDGNSPYGLEDVHEMVAELANPEFRETLKSIPYDGNKSVWQKIKEWFKKLLGIEGDKTALYSLSRALDDILEGYDKNEQKIYREQRADWERQMRDAGYTGDYVDFWEDGINMIGNPSIVQDKELINRLDGEPQGIGYRTVVRNADNTFGSPMAGKLSGKAGEKSKATSPYKLNQWEQSEENPQLATGNGKINLIKPGGFGTVSSVDYNPYIHIRENKLNKQFKNAWERPELVYIEVAYPESEMTSGYRAEKAAKTVGRHKWPGGDLILSRWDKPIRIVPWEEVADDWEREFKNKGVHFDIVSPHLLPILAERGVKILPPHKNMGEECTRAYENFKREQERINNDPLEAIRRSARQFHKMQMEDSNPMEAIRRAAEQYKRESNTNSETPLNISEKEVYQERLDTVSFISAEAYQDGMLSLKTAQNAIAHDKEIPDSQNAYQAENLMHGKNKNEQDLFNSLIRDPLLNTANRIMEKMGWMFGDVDRYVYTKSGLERNREFFVRDWLNAERSRKIGSYEELNDREQDMYDRKADILNTLFEDGDIETEEELNKRLEGALQETHDEYIDDIESEWNRVKRGGFIQLEEGTIAYPAYLDGMTDFIIQNIDGSYKPSEHDYSGFREMFGDEKGKYNEEEIIADLASQESSIGKELVDDLWGWIKNATDYGLERYLEAGMKSDEQIDRVRQMFNFYVPMRGFAKDTGEDMYQYFTAKDKSKNYVGGLLKHAKGRGSEASFPISTIFAMTYKAISDCNQNLVNQKLYRLCQANPNDLVVLSDSWAKLDENTGDFVEAYPDINEEMSEDEIREATIRFEDDMRRLAMEGKAVKITGKPKFDYRPADKKKRDEHIIEVYMNGRKKLMTVVGNPRMAQALNGQLRFERGNNIFSKWNSIIKNKMASLFTSYSPTFALRNMFRDWTHFRMMLGVREGQGYAKQAAKYYRKQLPKMMSLFKKYRNDSLNMDNEMERDFKDFMDNGGVTGFVQMQKIEDIQKEMEKLQKEMKEGKPIKINNKIWDYTLGAVEAFNEAIENNARFATYRASRHYAGRTKARSAYDAKEITVNFNRKGAGSKTAGFKTQDEKIKFAAQSSGITSQILGEGRIFFNATVQAICTTFKNFQNPDGSLNKKYIAKWAALYAAPPFLFGMALPYINMMIAGALGGDDDDEPYANLPEWTRRKNICVYIGNNNFITIPVGQELAAFLALGDMTAGLTYAPNLKPVDKSINEEMVGIFNTFSPVDVDTKITKGGITRDPLSEVVGRTFSVLAPIVAVEQNLSWTGRPIYREDRFQNDQYTPEYQMVYSGTNPVMVNASKLIHELGGGDDVVRGKLEVNPAIVQYLWEQYTGGPGKVFSNTISIGKDVKDILTTDDSEFNMRKVEGLKAFVQQGDDRTAYYRTQAKYRKYLEDANKLYDAVKGYEKASETDPTALLKLNDIVKGEDYVRMEIVREADRTLSKINRAANKAEGKERKELRNAYNEQVKNVVDLLDSVSQYVKSDKDK